MKNAARNLSEQLAPQGICSRVDAHNVACGVQILPPVKRIVEANSIKPGLLLVPLLVNPVVLLRPFEKRPCHPE